MDQFSQVPIAPPLRKSVRARQIVAAILGAIVLLTPHIRPFIIQDITIPIHLVFRASSLLCSIISIIGTIILSTIPANRPTKLMMYILVGIQSTTFILDLIPEFIPLSQSVSSYIYNIIFIVSMIGSLYSYSIIIKNNAISKSDITWINILCIGVIANLYLSIYMRFIIGWLNESYNLQYEELWSYFYRNSEFSYIWLILGIVAYFKFCTCKAFDGNADSATAESYSPLNRYTASLFITTAVTIGVLVAYYKLIAPALMSINI